MLPARTTVVFRVISPNSSEIHRNRTHGFTRELYKITFDFRKNNIYHTFTPNYSYFNKPPFFRHLYNLKIRFESRQICTFFKPY